MKITAFFYPYICKQLICNFASLLSWILEVINSFENYDFDTPTAITVGTFDGVHLGHRVILQQLFDVAKTNGLKSILFTFYPHPRMVLKSQLMPIKLIQTIDERSQILAQTDLDYLLVQPFTNVLANLTAREFVQDILVKKLKVQKLILGYDHRFGKGREGDFQLLAGYAKEFDFEILQIDAVKQKQVKISSTKIRDLLMAGRVQRANQCLGSPFALTGKVVEGEKIGRTIGFPTANIEVSPEKIIPKKGVYAVSFLWKGLLFYGMMNIGRCPTLQKEQTTIEVHFFDFSADLYGATITISLLSFLRSEQKFSGLAPLQKQLEKDKTNALQRIAILKSMG